MLGTAVQSAYLNECQDIEFRPGTYNKVTIFPELKGDHIDLFQANSSCSQTPVMLLRQGGPFLYESCQGSSCMTLLNTLVLVLGFNSKILHILLLDMCIIFFPKKMISFYLKEVLGSGCICRRKMC